MENLGDILKRLGDTSSRGNGNGERRQPPARDFANTDACGICGGLGWYTVEVPTGHPDFGRIITCECQQQLLDKDRSERLHRYSNLGYLSRFTFETLNPEGKLKDPENQRIFAEALASAEEYAGDPRGWLVLTGPNGCGKTHLAAAIANRCIDEGRIVFFVHVPDLMDHLRSTYSPASEVSYSDLFEQVRTAPMLVLDGLGSQLTTPWAQEKLQQIVNHRHVAQLATIVTTTAEVDEMEPYIRSRMADPDNSRVVQVASRQQASSHRLGRVDPQMMRRMTFDSFDARVTGLAAGQRASLEAALNAARNFAADPDGWLTFFGDTGVGKTHLAVAICNERMKQGYPVFFAFVPELLDYLRYTFTPESRVTYDHVFDEIKNTPMLVLDDLGQENSSPWAFEKLYQIIVYRHNAHLPTVITSMLDFSEQRGPIGSRVQDPSIGIMIRIDAPDYRIKDRSARGAGRKASSR